MHLWPDVSWCQAPFCARPILISAPCTRRMRVDLAMAGANHQPLIIRLVNQDFQQFFPNALIAPADKMTVRIAPVAVIRRSISHRAPVRIIQKTALINRRLSLATPPHCPDCPGKCGFSKAHTLSDIACLRCECVTCNPFITNTIAYFLSRDYTI